MWIGKNICMHNETERIVNEIESIKGSLDTIHTNIGKKKMRNAWKSKKKRTREEGKTREPNDNNKQTQATSHEVRATEQASGEKNIRPFSLKSHERDERKHNEDGTAERPQCLRNGKYNVWSGCDRDNRMADDGKGNGSKFVDYCLFSPTRQALVRANTLRMIVRSTAQSLRLLLSIPFRAIVLFLDKLWIYYLIRIIFGWIKHTALFTT